MGRWLEHSVTTEIQAPVEQVWTVWSDLEAMPRWMNWIESVTTPASTPWVAGSTIRPHTRAMAFPRAEGSWPATVPGDARGRRQAASAATHAVRLMP
jgi:uncharacterized membrane protein